MKDNAFGDLKYLELLSQSYPTIISASTEIIEMSTHRMRVRDTDKGKELMKQISDLRALLDAYRHGILNEKANKL